jgi:two-component system sensor histidine kinase EvgS
VLLRPSDLPPERLHFGIPSSKQPLAEALDLALAATSQAQRDALAGAGCRRRSGRHRRSWR